MLFPFGLLTVPLESRDCHSGFQAKLAVVVINCDGKLIVRLTLSLNDDYCTDQQSASNVKHLERDVCSAAVEAGCHTRYELYRCNPGSTLNYLNTRLLREEFCMQPNIVLLKGNDRFGCRRWARDLVPMLE